MVTKNESGILNATESAKLKTYTQDEVDALLASATAGNPVPAVEEGPHLTGDVAIAKRQQLVDAGISVDDESITGDMRKLLARKGN